MKILAISEEVPGTAWETLAEVLKEEAKTALQLYYDDVFREIYFTADGEAVIILESANPETARQMLNRLPLVEKGYITFRLLELHPYTGVRRLL